MKQFSKEKIQRMRNLATGNYGDKTKASSGYKSYSRKKLEGEIWEESGKTWTVKNGIKQNYTKLGAARKELKIPLSCPKCKRSMKNASHKKIYRLYSHCLNCQNEYEFDLHVKGKYKEWMESEVRKNFDSWTINQEQRFEKWFSTIDSENLITEGGKVESWSKLNSETKEVIRTRFKDWIESEKELTEKLLKGEE